MEVDGGYHGRRVVADARRDRDLRRLGYTVLHLDAALVLSALPQAVERVREALAGSGHPGTVVIEQPPDAGYRLPSEHPMLNSCPVAP